MTRPMGVEPLSIEGAQGLLFGGAGGARPWVDATVSEVAALRQLARLVGPGGSLMIGYGDGPTERALRRKVPPAATPLGVALAGVGCRWFKDWYFAEGGREGPAKLQGTLPLDAEHRRRGERRLVDELDRFLASSAARPADRRRARWVRALLGGAAAQADRGGRAAERSVVRADVKAGRTSDALGMCAHGRRRPAAGLPQPPPDVVVIRDDPDRVELDYGRATLVVTWDGERWMLTVEGWTRPMVHEIDAHGSGYYDPGNGLPDPDAYRETQPEIPDAPPGWTARAAERYRRDSRTAAVAAARRLAHSLAARPAATPPDADEALHRGWRPPER